ncbi:MAG: RteC domain-containing protein [Bacteroidetes bacterium]|nr:RteC domain-containing protein [Bacteroidota bacterium]
MKQALLQQYRALSGELHAVRFAGMSALEIVEESFARAMDHWNSIRRWVEGYTFTGIKEEIIFFRDIKPLFTSILDYCVLQYGSLLFCPAEENAERILYWKKERKRVQLFFTAEEKFCTYYFSHNNSMDDSYFVRLREEAMIPRMQRSYPDGNRSASTHDHLVAKVRAMGQYLVYIDYQLQLSSTAISRLAPADQDLTMSMPTLKEKKINTGDYGNMLLPEWTAFNRSSMWAMSIMSNTG